MARSQLSKRGYRSEEECPRPGECGVVSKNDKGQRMADGNRKGGKGENCRRGDLE